MRVMFRDLLLLSFAASVLSAQQTKPATPDSARTDSATQTLRRIIGVYDAETLDPIAGAQIQELLQTTAITFTSKTGHAGIYAPTMVSPKATGAVIAVMKLGYEPIDGLVVDLTDTTILRLRMNRLTGLPAVVTTAPFKILEDPGEWSGFAMRCQMSRASCFTTQDFLKYPAQKLSDHFSLGDGILVNCQAGVKGRFGSSSASSCDVQMSAVFGGKCVPSYYVNGALFEEKVDDRTKLEFIESLYPTSVLKGVEVYPPGYSRPLRFRDNPECGAIVLWLAK